MHVHILATLFDLNPFHVIRSYAVFALSLIYRLDMWHPVIQSLCLMWPWFYKD